jgi:hypothetical protein
VQVRQERAHEQDGERELRRQQREWTPAGTHIRVNVAFRAHAGCRYAVTGRQHAALAGI